MTRRERRFVAEYPRDGDRRKAAIRAGCPPARAAKSAWELMRRAEVRFALARELDERASRTGVTRERVLVELARVAFADLGAIARWDGQHLALVPSQDLGDDDAAALQSVGARDRRGRDLRVVLHDKTEALLLLARFCGVFDQAADDRVKGARERLLARLAALAG